MSFVLRASRGIAFRPSQPSNYLADLSRDAAAHDEGEHYSDRYNRNDREHDADKYEHREPPKFSHNHLLDSQMTVRDGCFMIFPMGVSR